MGGRLIQAIRYCVLYFFLILASFSILYPIAFTVGSSFSAGNSLATMSFLPIPAKPSLIHYQRLFNDTNYLHWYANTLKIAFVNMLCASALTVASAYVFSRFRFRGKKTVMMSMLILQIFPSFASMVALYIIIMRLGLLDNHFGLILIYVAGQFPYNIWLIKGYFDTIPRSIDEAAKMDGAGYFITFVRVIIPNVKPILSFLAITSFSAPWMDFVLPRLFLKSNENKTLAIGLFEMISGRQNDKFTMFAAGAILVAIPFMILFSLGQKYITQTMAASAVKE